MTDRLMIHDTGNSTLRATARHKKPVTDDLVLTTTRGPYDAGKSILLSRAQVRELRDWLDAWLDHGWPGIQPTEGPTTEDIIEHYREVAAACNLRADRAEFELAERLEFVAGLIPEAARPADLDEHYHRGVDREIRRDAELARLEDIRSAVVHQAWEIEQIGVERVTADALWRVLRTLREAASAQRKPPKKSKTPKRPAGVERPSLLEGAG